jgi:hypothetical protein
MSASFGCFGWHQFLAAWLPGALTRWMYEPDALIETIVVEERKTA